MGGNQWTTRPPNGSKAIMRCSSAGTLGVPLSRIRNCALPTSELSTEWYHNKYRDGTRSRHRDILFAHANCDASAGLCVF